MFYFKQLKDYLMKSIGPKGYVPVGLFEMSEYFRNNGPIEFEIKNGDGKRMIAISKNFRHGSIVTSGDDLKQLDLNIKDAILTSFDVPSSYAKEASIVRAGEKKTAYALA